MTSKSAALAVVAALATIGIAATAQDRPARATSLGVLDLKMCFDKDRNLAVKDIDADLQRVAEETGRRMKEAEPKERERLRADYMELYSRKKAALFNEIVSVAEAVRKERGLSVILRVETTRLSPDDKAVPPSDVTPLIDRRVVLCHEPEVDVTEFVLKRFNEEYAQKKKGEKKEEKKDKDF